MHETQSTDSLNTSEYRIESTVRQRQHSGISPFLSHVLFAKTDQRDATGSGKVVCGPSSLVFFALLLFRSVWNGQRLQCIVRVGRWCVHRCCLS